MQFTGVELHGEREELSMIVKVVRPREVQIYRCDGPNCDNECDSAFPDMSADSLYTEGTVSQGCGWIPLPTTRTSHDYREANTTVRGFPRSEPLYFCSWRCVALWARNRGCEAGEFDCSVTAQAAA
ncbi:hypothetical protein [Plantactinospora endophytica]|uniref:Uncharacterized protein n=1 Tax=Plantactinospora endophytica TaxID=673535 RepID=A0ABQ4EF66_9ACTN|nr:hypothetical protein [Plantactinospora endophytica]GIG93345.1 hypothetical protein Pen02_82810 [Plantactinospora endophytica]